MQHPLICTYAICKNESKFVRRWIQNIWNNGNGSDYICVLDTGSTDDTLEQFEQAAIDLNIPADRLIIKQKIISPWRFDIGRNESINIIPRDKGIDVCFCVDLDELVHPKFWYDLRNIVKTHPNFFKIYYKYCYHVDELGKQHLTFWYDKIHHLEGWQWEAPVHEYINIKESYKNRYFGQYSLSNSITYVKHYPDMEKSRSSYLPLLKIRYEENPDDPEALLYLGREYFFNDEWKEAVQYFTKAYINLSQENPPQHILKYRPNVMTGAYVCMQLGRCYAFMGMKDVAEFFYKKGIEFESSIGEIYLRLAQLYVYMNKLEEGQKTLGEMDKHAKPVFDWRFPTGEWYTWKRHQILGGLLSLQRRYNEALQHFVEGEKLIQSDADKILAYQEGFYADYDWLMGICKKDTV